MFSFSKIKSVAALVSGVAVVMVNETKMSALALQLQSDSGVVEQQNSTTAVVQEAIEMWSRQIQQGT